MLKYYIIIYNIRRLKVAIKINDIMKKLSRRTLIILIILLSLAIILILVNIKNPLELINSVKSQNSSATSNEKPPIVMIDAGHGGWEPGAGNKTINEKDIVLDISLEIEKILKAKNIDYYMIRSADTYISLEDRVRIANEKACKLFISIHNNSFTDSTQGGILTTYNPSSPDGKGLAKIMQSKISNIGMRDRAIMPRPNLYVLRRTEMPSLLLEIGFISNKKDLALLTSTSFQQKCAQQIVLGIEEIIATHLTVGAESPATD